MTYPTVGQDEFPAVCPYLGLADDADSHATYATEAHRCYRLPSPTRIATGHQETYCLGDGHTQCPVYRGEGIPRTSPPPAAATPPRAEQTLPATPPRPPRQPRPAPGEPARRRPAPGAVGPRPRAGGISMPVATIGLFAGAIVLIAVAFMVQQALSGDDDGGVSPTDAVATNAAATKTASAGKTATTAVTQTQQPGTPGTGTATRPAGTGTPGTPGATTTTTPGTGAKTYTVKSGDFCGSIAEAHNVTLAAFMAANPEIDADCSNLKIDQVVKIP